MKMTMMTTDQQHARDRSREDMEEEEEKKRTAKTRR
jgi:hypothetical protein